MAAFDFDGTWSWGDSLQDFARCSLGRVGWRCVQDMAVLYGVAEAEIAAPLRAGRLTD